MKDIVTKVYEYNELTEDAKKNARDWYSENSLDYPWYDCVEDDAIDIGRLFGLTIEDIQFSGFHSQGDGACLEGTYAYKPGSVNFVKGHAPLDMDLHKIVKDLQAIQKKHFYKLTAKIKQSGHYSHSGCTNIEVFKDYQDYFDTDSSYVRDNNHDGAELVKVLRRFMDWIYKQLNSTYDDLTSDESVIENIILNEHTFTESGKRFG